MCFGGCGSGIGSCTGSIAYILEKLASFIAMTAVIVCIVMTVTISLGLGVGLGYNYCFVDLRIMKESDLNGTINEGPHTTTHPITERTTLAEKKAEEKTTEKENDRRSMLMSPRPRRILPIPAIRHTISVPLNEDFDFPALLSKLRARNKNVTLEFITT
ncbi:hypothetical protein PYW08_004593 [Mythimna loreyi]|uniref:Uncharacterized protein n=1 Tax=Mythimna loreyi TaxID=667449 RepID=A0ACC2QPA7_9NEOP|nr:hypothetical protein PYW08_004593 [Mythimna loreyi]